MPLHFTGMASRREMEHPEEYAPKKAPSFDRVLKWDPKQPRDKDGKWTSGGGGRRGGTMGAPTEDAFGQPLRGNRVPAHAKNLSGFRSRGSEPSFKEQLAAQRTVSGIQHNRFLGKSGKTSNTASPHPGETSLAKSPGETPQTRTILAYLPGKTSTHTGSLDGKTPTKRSTFS